MSSSLSSWFSSIRSSESENEIDASLTSDIDSAFLSLDMNSNAFNISNESLLMPLGIGKSEITNRSSCAKRKMSARTGGGGGCAAQLMDGTAVMENTSPTILTTPCGHYLPTDAHIDGGAQGQLVSLIDCADGFASLNGSCSMFQYILMAPTSPATKLNEETVTYLNQGHSYEIKLKKISNGGECEGYLYRSIVRVIFHERRLQFMEREQLDSWRQTRPGERLMDIDIPLSYGLIDVRIDPQDLNCLEFVWDPRRDAGVFVKVHCISTEFTAKKHGGEKGVSFRVQMETYQHFMKMENYHGEDHPKANRSSESQIMHCASCQVKVFKPKGADRKLKTDREKMDKKTESEKEKYQPPFEYTVMTDVPIDQVCFYLEQLNRQAAEKSRPSKLPLPPPPTPPQQSLVRPSASVSSAAPGSSSSNSSCLSYGSGLAQFNAFFPDASSGGRSLSRQHSSNGCFVSDDHIVSTRQQPQALMTSAGDCSQGLVDSSSFEAARSPGTPSSTHSSASSSGGAFTGSFISALSTEAEVVTWLTANRFGHLLKKFQNFAGHDLLRLTRSDLIEICGISDGIRLSNSLAAKNIAPVITLYISSKPDNMRDIDQRMSDSCKESGAQNSKPNGHNSISRSSNEQCLGQMAIGGGGGGGGSNGFPYPDLDSSSSSSASRRLISEALESAKRHLYSNEDEDDDDDEDDERKRAKRNCVYKTNTVYNAVYLSQATRQHLLEQVAAVAKLSLQNLRNFRMIMSSGVLVHITDSVVENLTNESKFFYEIISDGSNFGWDFVLTPINNSSK